MVAETGTRLGGGSAAIAPQDRYVEAVRYCSTSYKVYG